MWPAPLTEHAMAPRGVVWIVCGGQLADADAGRGRLGPARAARRSGYPSGHLRSAPPSALGGRQDRRRSVGPKPRWSVRRSGCATASVRPSREWAKEEPLQPAGWARELAVL